jgi:hypothetical protein
MQYGMKKMESQVKNCADFSNEKAVISTSDIKSGAANSISTSD